MSGFLSTYGANAILDGTAMPATLYIQLHIGNPSAAGTANVATETTRKSMTRDAASGGATQNAAAIQWFNYPAAETINHLTLWDASSGGNCWWVIPRTGGGLVMAVTDTLTIDDSDLDLLFEIWT